MAPVANDMGRQRKRLPICHTFCHYFNCDCTLYALNNILDAKLVKYIPHKADLPPHQAFTFKLIKIFLKVMMFALVSMYFEVSFHIS